MIYLSQPLYLIIEHFKLGLFINDYSSKLLHEFVHSLGVSHVVRTLLCSLLLGLLLLLSLSRFFRLAAISFLFLLFFSPSFLLFFFLLPLLLSRLFLLFRLLSLDFLPLEEIDNRLVQQRVAQDAASVSLLVSREGRLILVGSSQLKGAAIFAPGLFPLNNGGALQNLDLMW